MGKMTIEQAAQKMASAAFWRYKPIKNGDIGTVVARDQDGNEQVVSKVAVLNRNGYKPGISILTGGARIIVNIIEIVKDIFLFITFKQSFTDTAKNIGWEVVMIVRGAVEMVPFAGNTVVFMVDCIRMVIINHQVRKEAEDNTVKYFVNGQLIYKVIGYDQNQNQDFRVGAWRG